MKLQEFNQTHLESTEKNGWKLYEKDNGEICAYYRFGSDDGEQLLFDKEESFANWILAEHKER